MVETGANETEKGRSDILTFYIDSGCTHHMVSDKLLFLLVNVKKPNKTAVAKNDTYLEAVGVGNIEVFSGRDRIKCTIQNVFYVPMLRKNLLAVKKLESSGRSVIFQNSEVRLKDKNNRIIGIGSRKNLYEISFEVIGSPESLNVRLAR